MSVDPPFRARAHLFGVTRRLRTPVLTGARPGDDDRSGSGRELARQEPER